MNDSPSYPNGDQGEPVEGVRINDKRRIDPDTYQVREQASALAPEVDASVLDADLDEAESKVAELTDDLRRVHAEYANYRKRIDREREALRSSVIGSTLSELLPVLDDIERAREHGELDGAFKTVSENLEQIVARLGLETFGAPEDIFDPQLHEALTSEDRDGLSEPIVVSVYQPGYRHGDRVLRPARVAVAGA
ncbi:MAG: nucleotide exchange factor GrpE [Candidatus Nanopelagicales bacterium]